VNSSQEIASGFSRINNYLDIKFSMRNFLQGHLEEVESDVQDRKALAKEIHDLIKSLAQAPDLTENGTKEMLLHSQRLLTEWKRILLTFPHNELIPLSRRSIIPSEADMTRQPLDLIHRTGPVDEPIKSHKPVKMQTMTR
jgi:hypothetical protein